MPLRTYPLIVHPAFLRFIEGGLKGRTPFEDVAPALVPEHRPALVSVTDIGRYLDISPSVVWSILRNKNKHYRSFEFRKKSGGTRHIDAPRTFLKVIQWWILDTILVHSHFPDFVFGFIRGRSFIDNARRHVGAGHILNVDIKDFFPSITTVEVARVYAALGYDIKVADGLAELCTLNGVLPQGAPTSPSLANLVFAQADERLRQWAEGRGLTYTRYADDLTFSSSARIPAETVAEVAAIIAIDGFRLNDAKTRFLGANQVKDVTGLIVGKDGVALPREFLNRARGWFHAAATKPEEHRSSLQKVRGTTQLIRQVGGRGSEKVLALGERAIEKLSALSS